MYKFKRVFLATSPFSQFDVCSEKDLTLLLKLFSWRDIPPQILLRQLIDGYPDVVILCKALASYTELYMLLGG